MGGNVVCMVEIGSMAGIEDQSSSIMRCLACTQWRERERQMMEEENRKILEYARQQQQNEEARMEEKRLKEEASDSVYKKVMCFFVEKQLATSRQ